MFALVFLLAALAAIVAIVRATFPLSWASARTWRPVAMLTATVVMIAVGVVLAGSALAVSIQTYWLNNVHSTTASQTLPSLAKGTCTTLSFTVPGAQAGDSVAVAIPNTAGITTLSVTPVATSGGVTAGVCNGGFGASTYSGGTALTWGVATFRQGYSF
jgi:hypothetical protein